MRFAGSEPITNYLTNSLDMGEVSQQGQKARSAVKNAGTELAGQVGASGITAAGQVEAAGIMGAAQAQAAGMGAIGDIGSSLLGAFGSAGKSDPWSNLDTSNSYSGTGRGKYGSFQDPTASFAGLTG